MGHNIKGVNEYVRKLKKGKIEPTSRITLIELQNILLRFRNLKPDEITEKSE